MANRYIKNPYDIVAVGDVVTVWVLTVDQERRRVSLTMIRPGTVRQAPQRRSQAPRAPQAARAQQGRRPPRVQSQAPPPASTPPPAPSPPQVESAPPAPAPAASAVVNPPPAPPPPRPAPPPRKPKRHVAKPKLSKDALERKVPLRSFGELEVFFETQDKKGQPPAP
jgi:uncharacterized protein